MSDSVRIRRALLSASDKAGITDFAGALTRLGVELISTGATAATLRQAGLVVRDVADVTGLPEMLGGRVKTLHPKIYGGLLAIRGSAEHDHACAEYGIQPIDLLAVNLYPFEETVARQASPEDTIENIDIGGPAMIRAAAKNYAGVTVIVDPADYGRVLSDMEANGGAVSAGVRRLLAAKAFARTAAYDAAISNWLAGAIGWNTPDWKAFGGQLRQELRYGENPHQWAGFYVARSAGPGVATAVQLQGKELSYNNIADTDAALQLISEFDPAVAPAVAIIKHANPCGVAVGRTLQEAYLLALRTDATSAFGGIVALNAPIDREAAEEITKIFTEAVVAPDASEDARAVFAGKPNLRLLTTGGLPDPRSPGVTFRSVSGGFLVQSRDNAVVDDLEFKVVTQRAPTAGELTDLKFAFRVAKHVKSNAIVFAKGGATVGIGAGQMSRVDAAGIAAWKSDEAAKAAGVFEPLARGSVVASDAFFPFADGLLAVAEAGATAVIQPGGSMRDAEVIKAADDQGIAMVFTGLRHFRH